MMCLRRVFVSIDLFVLPRSFAPCFPGRSVRGDSSERMDGAVQDVADEVADIERDSRKDEAVVFIFIVATVGLLGWAAIRPWVAKWYEVRLTSPRLPKARLFKQLY